MHTLKSLLRKVSFLLAVRKSIGILFQAGEQTPYWVQISADLGFIVVNYPIYTSVR